MSQLKKNIILLFCVLIATSSYMVFARAGQKTMRAEIESPFKWGKGMGPIQVRIAEKQVSDNVVTLEGQVSTKLDEVNIEWKLPAGTEIVSGNQTELAKKTSEDEIITRTLTVKVSKAASNSQIVFFVYADDGAKRKGNSAVYGLKTSDEEKASIKDIQQFMKARGARPVK